jgi:hypothetical protein
MKFVVVIACHGRPQKTYTSDFLPRVGDTIVNDTDIPCIVTEVIYNMPSENEDCISAVVNTEWR